MMVNVRNFKFHPALSTFLGGIVIASAIFTGGNFAQAATPKVPYIESLKINVGDGKSIVAKKSFVIPGARAIQGMSIVPKIRSTGKLVQYVQYKINSKTVNSKKAPYAAYIDKKGKPIFQKLTAGVYKFKATPKYYDSRTRRTISGKTLTLSITVDQIVVVQAVPTATNTPTPTPTNVPRFTDQPIYYDVLPKTSTKLDLSRVNGYATWESRMLKYADIICFPSDPANKISNISNDDNVWNFDGLRAFVNILKFESTGKYQSCIDEIKSVERNYILDNNANIPAIRIFPVGLLFDYQVSGEAASKQAVIELSENPAYADKFGSSDISLAFENANLLQAFLVRELIDGHQIPNAAKTAANNAISDLKLWIQDFGPDFRPLQLAETADALIRYYQFTRDEQVPPLIKQALTKLWSLYDTTTYHSFPLTDCSNLASSSDECKSGSTIDPKQGLDLNLLFAYSYLWVGQHFHDGDSATFVSHADRIFLDGVQGQRDPNDSSQLGAYLGNDQVGAGKHYAQNYSLSFDYVMARALK